MGDYAINLNNVKSAYCTLEKLTYIKNPTQNDYKTAGTILFRTLKHFISGIISS
jgi:hypothetical protein